MSIMVGYVPTPVGEAAVAAAITEAKLRSEELLIVNSVREGSRVDKSVASDEDLQRLPDDVVRPLPLHVDDEADAAGIALGRGVVQALVGRACYRGIR